MATGRRRPPTSRSPRRTAPATGTPPPAAPRGGRPGNGPPRPACRKAGGLPPVEAVPLELAGLIRTAAARAHGVEDAYQHAHDLRHVLDGHQDRNAPAVPHRIARD